MENNKKQKRFYKKNEVIWIIELKTDGKVENINKEDLTMTVSYNDNGKEKKFTGKMWQFDKLKYAKKEQLVKSKKDNKCKLPTVYFAKVRESAIIPSKRDEDAGYDIYANVEGKEFDGNPNLVHEIYLPAFKTTLVPTGIAMALPKTHYFNLKHERGSTGKVSMSVLAGVVDSGYRGEIFIALTPLHKDVLITSEVTETEVLDNIILYPYSKAICQGTIDLVPHVEIKEINFEDLAKIKSERGDTKLGQSGK